jgi:hypothetical protein
MSKQNIISRFACTQSKRLKYGEFIAMGVAGPTRQEINSKMKELQYKKFLDLFGVKQRQIYISNDLSEHYRLYVKTQKDCIQQKFQFSVDRIIQ